MNIAKFIDHTLLRPDATPSQILKLCQEARMHQFASVCINPCYVLYAKELLHASDVKVGTVIGFPLGANNPSTKIEESRVALAQGATELDMVIHIGRLKAGIVRYVESEIRTIADIAHERQGILKVIIETALLTDEEKTLACQLAKRAGADFVKTCTGFSGGGATVKDIALMRAVVGPQMGVKASGGISDYVQALLLIEAGATRIGTSKGLAIMAGTPMEGLGGY